MKVSVVTAPGETQVVDAPKPTVRPADVLVKIRACGICGTDTLFISMGGSPSPPCTNSRYRWISSIS